jgi:hypothetical protein
VGDPSIDVCNVNIREQGRRRMRSSGDGLPEASVD